MMINRIVLVCNERVDDDVWGNGCAIIPETTIKPIKSTNYI